MRWGILSVAVATSVGWAVEPRGERSTLARPEAGTFEPARPLEAKVVAAYAEPEAADSIVDPVDDPEAKISLSIGHHFSRDAARERITYLLNYWRERFGITSSWAGDRVVMVGRIFGMNFRARFEITDSNVVAVASDPGYFMRGRAEHYVNRKLRKYLHPTYAEPNDEQPN
jgi:hypothetical protein